MNPTSHALQVAARVWLPEKGCQHLHTSGISDAEAHALIEHFAGQTPPLSDERTSWEPHSWRTYPTVYVIPQRRPDPNSPHRNVTNLWILLDPRRRLSDVNVRRIAETSVTPNADSEFDSVVRDWIKLAISSPSSDSQSASTFSTTTLSTATDSNVSPRRESHPKSLKWVVMAAILVLAVVITAVYLVSQTKSLSSESNVAKPSNPTSEIGGEGTSWKEWKSKKDNLIKDQMKGSLGLHRPELEIDGLEDAEILEEFVSLFYVDLDDLGLNDTESKHMNDQRENTSPHPMIEFLDQFESPSRQVTINKDEWGKQCATSMKSLTEHFPDLRHDANPKSQSPIPIETVKALRNRLDYEAFYRIWHENNYRPGPYAPYLDGTESLPEHNWVEKVRTYLKKRFSSP